jgi:hypothetical protein
MPLISCPSCHTADALVGVDDADGKSVECSACGHRWRRDLTPTCRLCGSTDLEAVATATLQEAGRGEQRTPSGIRNAYRCWDCGARDATASSPIAPQPDWRERQRTGVRVPSGTSAFTAGSPRQPAGDRVESAFGLFTPGGTVGGRWQLTALRRWSSTGTVWEAADADRDRQVTFKLLHPAVSADEAVATLHEASARAAAAIRHPHLLRILEVQRRGGEVLVIAEAVRGTTLDDQDERRAPHALLPVAVGIGEALATMHEHGLAHLDIRPDKILIPDAGPARLIDFGSGRVRARIRDGRAPDAGMAWQAPEQIVAGRHGPAADVYSLGLTLWVAAGGRLAELGVNPAAQARYRLQQDLPAFDAGDEVGPLNAAITAATRRRPGDRPTANGFVELLRDG